MSSKCYPNSLIGFTSIGLTGLPPINFIYIDTPIGVIFGREENHIILPSRELVVQLT